MNILGKLVMKPNTNQPEQSRIKIGKNCISKNNNSIRGLGSWNEACRLSKISSFMPIRVAFLEESKNNGSQVNTFLSFLL
jgi:hypothetical protein